MTPPRPSIRLAAAIVAAAGLAVAAAVPPRAVAPDPRPNVILVVTDDQRFDTLPSDAMPWLSDQLERPGWTLLSTAVASTPMCCPARATLLTGRYAFRTGVQTNRDGARLDESQTLATWLDEAGYTTGLVGKYLNGYPFDRGPYVPAGWDRWYAKRNLELATTYRDYPVVDQGVPKHVRHGYATDVLAAQARAFVRTAPVERPFFLMFAPSAPHAPWSPAPRHAGALPTGTAEPIEPDPLGSPGWVRALPEIDVASRTQLDVDARRAREALLAVDDAIRSLLHEVAARGQLDRTVVVVLTDNGYSFGEHRWVGKGCPYEGCVRIPLAIRIPGSAGGEVDVPVSNVDVAPTIAELTGAAFPSGREPDGRSLVPLLRDGVAPARDGLLLTYAGDARIPGWWALRTERWKLVLTDDGSVELYEVARDPGERRNLAADPAHAAIVARLTDDLRTILPGLPTDPG